MTIPFNLASFADKTSSTGTANPSAISDVANTSTGAIGFPVGTTAQRNGTPVNGMTRINSTTNVLEVYYNGSWVSIASFTPPAPTVIGQAYGGGYYAGKISTAGNGVADYYLILAPKATGEIYGLKWGSSTYVNTGATSQINGPSNSALLASLGASYESATWCEALTIDGYTDWYLPSKNELEVIYYFLKPSADANYTGNLAGFNNGTNPNAVSPEPISTGYSSGSPAQTSVEIFKTGGSEALTIGKYYMSSTQMDIYNSWCDEVTVGFQYQRVKDATDIYTRAVRRIAI